MLFFVLNCLHIHLLIIIVTFNGTYKCMRFHMLVMADHTRRMIVYFHCKAIFVSIRNAFVFKRPRRVVVTSQETACLRVVNQLLNEGDGNLPILQKIMIFYAIPLVFGDIFRMVGRKIEHFIFGRF